MRILTNTGPTTLTKTWYINGTATDVGTVTIGIIDANGDTVLAAGSTTTNNGDGTYTATLADQTQPNVLFITWTRTNTGSDLTDTLEIVGSQLFTEAQIRAFDNSDGTTGALSSATVYPDAALADERDRVTDLLEQWTGRSWISRYCRIVAPGPSGYRLALSSGHRRAANGRPVGGPGYTYGVTELIRVNDGASVSGATFDPITGHVWRTDSAWTKSSTSSLFNVTVEYVYGEPWPTEGVDRIAMLLVRDRLVKSKIPDSAISIQNDDGAMQLVREGGPFQNVSRIPEVNAWVAAHRMPGVG